MSRYCIVLLGSVREFELEKVLWVRVLEQEWGEWTDEMREKTKVAVLGVEWALSRVQGWAWDRAMSREFGKASKTLWVVLW
eukprot:CAMPEP_0114398622 /NCGR_PEP_ID=MMETSP0102-20121206/15021_1 /TAXON_ID=38822 ORGANISM="Pteridomonas danica, Strain PT" /NCGR_SAMPLE_ID=MMETSP0102 /ASSEMBLY_ACC=CAM_ASM_000212 /LENGTH=80 /DNA_ID=CAMNT_0001560063 /DNA_START=623 /DNA_END=862 /DNA_ORIENTATION=+